MNNTTHGIGLSGSPYVKFVRATPDSFKKLTLKDGNTLYFVSNIPDAYGKLYLGDKLISSGIGDKTDFKLADLSDVMAPIVRDKDILFYNADQQAWIPTNLEDIISSLESKKADKYVVQKVQDYLYYIDYPTLDYEKGVEYLLNTYNPKLGGCASIRNGNIYGRNYDWHYDNNASFIINRRATQGKLANIGVAGGLISNELANSGLYDEKYDYQPFLMLDGINEKGVVCNINILPIQDKKSNTTGTNPGKPTVPMVGLVRWILDEAVSADDAIYRIKNEYNIVAPSKAGAEYEFHFMIADKVKTYVVEFENNAPVIISQFLNNKPIMTNFYLNGFEGGKIGLTPHANGLERYDILANGYANGTTISGMKDLLKEIYFTKAYSRDTVPFWYSEFYYRYDTIDLTIDSTPAECDPVVDEFIEEFNHRTRDDGATWQTVHSSMYDIKSCILYIVPQEGEQIYNFRLSIPSNDELASMLAKLDTIEEGAQKNVIEGIKVQDTILPVEGKIVTLPLALGTTPGLVIGTIAENGIFIKDDSTMEVNSLNVNKLVQTEDEWLILGGGDSINTWLEE